MSKTTEERLATLDEQPATQSLRWSDPSVNDHISGILIKLEDKTFEGGSGLLAAIKTDSVILHGQRQPNGTWSMWLKDSMQIEFRKRGLRLYDWIGVKRVVNQSGGKAYIYKVNCEPTSRSEDILILGEPEPESKETRTTESKETRSDDVPF